MQYKRFILPAALLLISALLMLGNDQDRTNKSQWFGRTVFYPFTQSLRWAESNAQLRRMVHDLQLKVVDQTLKNLSLQNTLRSLYNTTAIDLETDYSDFEIAEVIGYSGQFHERNLIVNRGRNFHIEQDNPVISASGIVGKVIQTSELYSIVLPFSNPRFQLPVMNRHSSVQGILQADIGGKVSMNMIRLGSEIAVGDTIVTSNLSRLFPKGYPVGTVRRIKESQDNLFISAEVAPFTLIENLEHVFIIRQRHNHE